MAQPSILFIGTRNCSQYLILNHNIGFHMLSSVISRNCAQTSRIHSPLALKENLQQLPSAHITGNREGVILDYHPSECLNNHWSYQGELIHSSILPGPIDVQNYIIGIDSYTYTYFYILAGISQIENLSLPDIINNMDRQILYMNRNWNRQIFGLLR